MKTTTKKEAFKVKENLIKQGKKNVTIYKFATKCKYQFFVGTYWEWLLKIS